MHIKDPATLETVQTIAKQTLSEKRYHHIECVANMCCTLAKRYSVNEDDALLAAWLHDICKEKPKEELLQILQQDDIIAGSTVNLRPAFWHGPCAAIYAKHSLYITNAAVLSAISCHTLAKENMATLDKLLYVADYIGLDRGYPEAAILRQTAQISLEKAALQKMEFLFLFYEQRQIPIVNETIIAYESLKKSMQV